MEDDTFLFYKLDENGEYNLYDNFTLSSAYGAEYIKSSKSIVLYSFDGECIIYNYNKKESLNSIQIKNTFDDGIDKDIESNVLKVGHHGSGYSSSAKFIKKVNPDYAIISVGKNNSYNHPKNVVIKKLERIGSTIYRTDKQGTIKVISDGNNIKIETIKTDTNGG